MRRSTTRKLIVTLVFVAVAGCSKGPYRDLESRFRAKASFSSRPIAQKTIILVSPKHRGAFAYKNVVAIRLSSTGIEIRPTLGFMQTVQVPIGEIRGCSMKCFGGSTWDAVVLVGQPPTEIGIPNATELINWCWQNRVPMVTTKVHDDWLYKHMPLPDRAAFAAQFSSRARFDEQTRRTCMGY